MGKIFIKKLTIENYKCFENKSVDFSIPDEVTPGSGLNILIGENGNGKTTVLEAIDYLTQSAFSSENKLKIGDFRDFEKEIIIRGETEEFNCSSSIEFYRDWYFKANGFEFIAKSRDKKSSGKLLSSPFQIKNNFLLTTDYIKQDGSIAKTLDARDKVFSNSRIGDDEANFFFFDKNRTRQISTGNYKTTFEKICDDLNWKFIREFNKKTPKDKKALVDSVCGDYFKSVIETAQSGAGNMIALELKDFFNKEEYENLNVELLNLLHPFSSAFFALRKAGELKQISTKDLGSGVEIILTLLLLKNIAGISKGSIVYLIDEPELHLHPKAQEKLLELLVEESKTKQIFISTHSPYMFNGVLSTNAKILIFKKNSDGEVEIQDARSSGWGVFGRWSPTWGEINYFAYDLPTVEFHNELYGFLQAKAISIDQKHEREVEFENYLLSRGLDQNKSWIRERGGVAQPATSSTLQTYIRNFIHHPENNHNQAFTGPEFRQSINEMISIL